MTESFVGKLVLVVNISSVNDQAYSYGFSDGVASLAITILKINGFLEWKTVQ